VYAMFSSVLDIINYWHSPKQVILRKKSAVATFQTSLPCSFERCGQEGNKLKIENSNNANSCYLCDALAESFMCYS
jgi:hypothetical protein